MRTPIEIDQPILKELKRRGKIEGKSLGALASELLAQALVTPRQGQAPSPFACGPAVPWAPRSTSPTGMLFSKRWMKRLEFCDLFRGNLVPDIHLAALLRQHGVPVICTHDRDYRKFDCLKVVDPVKG